MNTTAGLVIATGLVAAASITAAIVVPRLGPAAPGPAPVAPDSPPDTARALDRLNAAIASAPAAAFVTDARRLADARAWVAAHRPADRPYNDLEARSLALLAAAAAGNDGSALPAMNAALIGVETLRALDADRDGLLTDDEIARFLADPFAVPDPSTHPYLAGRGAGDAPRAVLERARLEQWDTDASGFLSDAERAAGGAAESARRVDLLVDAEIERMSLAGLFDGDGPSPDSAAAELRVGLAGPSADPALPPPSAATARAMLDAMRLADLSDAAVSADLTANMPLPPDLDAFDADADGEASADETRAFNQACVAYDREIAGLRAGAQADFLRRRFASVAAAGDADADGRVSPREWDAYTGRIERERDDRLFLLSYDLDRDGSVGNAELMALLDWHRSASPRADANYDGVVDVRDLVSAMDAYKRLQP